MYIILNNFFVTMYTSHPGLIVLVTSFRQMALIVNGKCKIITLMPRVYKCECDQFKQLWHSIFINDNNVMNQLFKIPHCKEMYIQMLPEHLKQYSTSE